MTNLPAILRQAQDLKLRVHKDSERYDEVFRVGIEIEAGILDDDGNPVNAAPLIKELQIKSRGCYEIDDEYGICQLEFKSPSMSFDRLQDLHLLLEKFVEDLDVSTKKKYKDRQVFPVFLGANPSPKVLEDPHNYRQATI